MAERTAPQSESGENTPEQVAFKLMLNIMLVERMSFNPDPPAGLRTADRSYILSTYAECLMAVRDPKLRSPSSSPRAMSTYSGSKVSASGHAGGGDR